MEQTTHNNRFLCLLRSPIKGGCFFWKSFLSQREITGAITTTSGCSPLACVVEEVSSNLLASELVIHAVFLRSARTLPRSRTQCWGISSTACWQQQNGDARTSWLQWTSWQESRWVLQTFPLFQPLVGFAPKARHWPTSRPCLLVLFCSTTTSTLCSSYDLRQSQCLS